MGWCCYACAFALCRLCSDLCAYICHACMQVCRKLVCHLLMFACLCCLVSLSLLHPSTCCTAAETIPWSPFWQAQDGKSKGKAFAARCDLHHAVMSFCWDRPTGPAARGDRSSRGRQGQPRPGRADAAGPAHSSHRRSGPAPPDSEVQLAARQGEGRIGAGPISKRTYYFFVNDLDIQPILCLDQTSIVWKPAPKAD